MSKQADKSLHTNPPLKRPLILAAVMLGMFLSAIEGTIVATAMPSIVADLGGFSKYSWVFSAYLLTNAATVLVFGKIADRIGRKPVFVSGVTIFLIGSTLAGFSESMTMLIATRFVQGVGAGALMTVGTTIVGDIYNREERAKIQGYLSSVWGISAVSGPLLGGFFVDVLDWRYVFWMNIPLGILAMLGIMIFLKENIEKKKHAIDFAGSIYVMIAISLCVYILVEGGAQQGWTSPFMLMMIGAAICSILLFIRHEKKAAEPMFPTSLWTFGFIRLANLTTLITGMIVIGVSSYLPAFVQGVMGKSATVAGFTLTTMSIGWPIAATVSGRLLLRIGYRTTAIIGSFSLICGAVLFFFLSPEKGPIWAGVGSFFIGIGMGMTSTSFIVGIQSTVKWSLRGTATATNMFMRSLGSALGVALLGGLLNGRIQSSINEANLSDSITVNSVNELLDTEGKTGFSVIEQGVLEQGLTSGLHVVYTGMLILACMTFVLIYLMPKHKDL